MGAASRRELQALADGLLIREPESVARCIEFVESESQGIGHGRARALMCRRLKHVVLSEMDSRRLVDSILNRFKTGRFSEQFRDMLKLALVLDLDSTTALAESLAGDQRNYVKLQARWILDHYNSEGLNGPL